jgi:DNA-binding FrmR family transcriptional regulator
MVAECSSAETGLGPSIARDSQKLKGNCADLPSAASTTPTVITVSHGCAAYGSRHGYTPGKDDYLKRLRRIEGQVRGLQKMVEDDKYCIDILTQVSAATRALQSVALGLLEDHLAHCVTEAAAEGGDVAAAKVREASDAIARLVKS